MTTAHSARAAIVAAIEARLGTALTVYVDEVPNLPPVRPKGQFKPYVAIYPSAGRTDPNPSLGLVAADFLWAAQVTFVAGTPGEVHAVLDTAVPLLDRWSPTIAGISCGPLRPVENFDPGPVRRDDKFAPPRHYLPTQWQLHVITA